MTEKMLVRYDAETGDIVGTIRGGYNREDELVPNIEVAADTDLGGKKVDLDTLKLVSEQ